jgi:hypothetical protein
MIETILNLLKQNKGHAGAYTLLIIAGISGYTDIILELGQLRAAVEYKEQTIDRITDEYAAMDAKLEACLKR